MNKTIEIFLAILKAALRGERPELPMDMEPAQWQAVFRLAELHKLLPLVYEAVYNQPSLAGERQLLEAARPRVRRQVIAQAMRTAQFLELNDRLQAAGIQALVVKGVVCRSLYPKPDHRPSGDEDVLIPAARYEACHRVLTDFGMATELTLEQMSDSYEVPYRKADSPLYIELHKHLFPPESDAYGEMNRFFEGAGERGIPLKIQGHTVYTLAPTDHLFYLICHAFKHFLHSGFGIRQVCDIILFANAYGKEVDWMQVLENCRAIHGEKFAAAIFEIGKKYLVFDPRLAAYPLAWQEIRVDEQPMLMDLLAGGLYGDATMSRKHSSNITLDAVAAQKTGKRAKGALASSVFPSAAKLAGRYPYLKNHPYLLPVAWCSRLWTYGRQTRGDRDNNAADALKIGTERLELMKLYDILE